MAKKVTGGCACGSVRYQLLDKPMFVHCCHCDDCQRLTGSAFVLNAIIETQAIKLLQRQPGSRAGAARERSARHLPLSHVPDRALERLRTQAQSPVRPSWNARQPAALKPDVHIYTRWKAKWLKLPKGTPSFRDYYKTRKLWPEASLKRLDAALGRTKN